MRFNQAGLKIVLLAISALILSVLASTISNSTIIMISLPISIMLILAIAFGQAMRMLHQPAVLGEILGAFCSDRLLLAL